MVLSARAVQKAHWRCVLERLKHAIDPYSPSLHSWKPISNGSRNVLWRSAILVCKQTAERARKKTGWSEKLSSVRLIMREILESKKNSEELNQPHAKESMKIN